MEKYCVLALILSKMSNFCQVRIPAKSISLKKSAYKNKVSGHAYNFFFTILLSMYLYTNL